MTDRPIIFSGPMVRALLDGRKTQTRRVIKPQFPPQVDKAGFTVLHPPGFCAGRASSEPGSEWHRKLPYAIGDRLWVRETWRIGAWREDGRVALDYRASGPGRTPWLAPGIAATEPLIEASREDVFRANDIQITNGIATWEPGHGPCRWRPPIHMPRWASRLTLTVTDARVQRVQDISAADAMEEGCCCRAADGYFEPLGGHPSYSLMEFRSLWNNLNAARGFGWDANPWVVALTFTVERRNIDAEPKPCRPPM